MRDSFNIKVLKDKDLTPVDKLIYIGLASQTNIDGRSTLKRENLMEMLQVNQGDKIAQLTNSRVDEAIVKLIANKYLEEDLTIRIQLSKEDAYGDMAQFIMDYISEARIVRGYSTRKLTGGAHRTSILRRLSDGASLDEMIAVVNFRFESVWHKQNNKWLVPTNLFKKSKFDEVLSTVPDVPVWADYTITKFGITEGTGRKEESEGTM